MSNGSNQPNPGLETRDIGIAGMTCDHCVRRVTQALQRVDGVRDVSVNRETARARVTFEQSKTDIPALHNAILKSGYEPAPVVPSER
jgi:Cu+-exporting ATPase